MPPIVEVQDLVKRYKNADTNAVDGISLTVEAGQFFALLGPNGAGKTTTLSILTTTLAPTSGLVRVAGEDVAGNPAAVREKVGIIFQRPSLDLNLSAEENVRFHAILYGLFPFRPSFGSMPRPYRERLQELAKLLGIEDELRKPVKAFSGGMRRKLEILRSLMHRPSVLFLDEPTTGLDPVSRRTLWSYLSHLRAEMGTTIFLTTHYLEEAEGADVTCILDKGRVITHGTPQQVKAQLVEEYVVVDAEDREALRGELRRLGVQFEEAATFKLSLDGRTTHEVLRTIETPLTLVKTHSPSLEDAYLDIVGRDAG